MIGWLQMVMVVVVHVTAVVVIVDRAGTTAAAVAINAVLKQV